jgi:hypothetical protein
MAHFAQLDNNVVINIIVVNNNELLDQDGNEVEQKGIDFCKTLFGQDTDWVQTSYNSNFRKNYASFGGTYDPIKDAFIPTKPMPSWILDELVCQWVAPVPYPDDGKRYKWDESIINWVEVVSNTNEPTQT